MDDFNSDNAKIDAAIKAEETARSAALSAEASARKSGDDALRSAINSRSALELLKTVTTTAAAQRVDVSVEGIRWGDYHVVLMEVIPQGNAGMIYVQTGDASVSAYSSLLLGGRTGVAVIDGGCRSTVLFFVFKNPSGGISALTATLGVSSGYSRPGVSYEKIKTLHFSADGEGKTLDRGTVVRFWGLK